MYPRYLIKNQVMTGGNFMSKFPRFARPVPVYKYGGYTGESSYKRPPLLPAGNLDFESYRFFCGVEKSDAIFSQCRICLKVLYARESRLGHGKELGCFRLMTEALTLTLVHGKCVICGFATPHRKWGIPLCPYPTYECQHVWCFNSVQPTLLRNELKIAYGKRVDKNVTIPRLDY